MISAVLMLFQMAPNLPASNRIFYWTYDLFIIRQLKAFKRSHNLDDSYDPYKAAYGSMPTHAASNQAIQQMYINGHFCYAYKFGIITNGLGIVRDITFYNKDFLKSHPDIVVEKKSVPLIKINLLRIQRHCFQF